MCLLLNISFGAYTISQFETRRELTISLGLDIGASTPILVPWERDINYTIAKMGNKPSFPLDTPLGCLLAHWERYQLEGLKKKKNLSNTVLDTGLLTPWEEGENDPSQDHLGSTPFYSSVYTVNARVKEVPYVQAFMALYQDSQKRRQCKLRDRNKGFFKVLLARSEAKDPLALLLTPSAWTERTGKGKFRQPWKSRD